MLQVAEIPWTLIDSVLLGVAALIILGTFLYRLIRSEFRSVSASFARNPYGETPVWRAGANQSTRLKVFRNLKIAYGGGKIDLDNVTFVRCTFDIVHNLDG